MHGSPPEREARHYGDPAGSADGESAAGLLGSEARVELIERVAQMLLIVECLDAPGILSQSSQCIRRALGEGAHFLVRFAKALKGREALCAERPNLSQRNGQVEFRSLQD